MSTEHTSETARASQKSRNFAARIAHRYYCADGHRITVEMSDGSMRTVSAYSDSEAMEKAAK